MICVHELRTWLEQFTPDHQIGIDEGGLTLQSINDERIYLEVGGLLEPEEESTEEKSARLTHNEQLEGLADRGIDTWADDRGEK